jgi:2-C-methyl-D-erythritol 4-phosphate cytidylyltransferase
MLNGIGVIVMAAGSSRRMAGTDKLWLDLGGKPLLARTLDALIAGCDDISQLVVVAGAQTQARAASVAPGSPWNQVECWVEGGATRQDSVYLGLQAIRPCELVLIHDGARPLPGRAMIQRGLATARRHGSALATVPVTDTIKLLDPEGRVLATPDRAALHAAQTPQIYAWDLLLRAYVLAGQERALCTDDAAVLERAGFPVFTFPGERTNLKVSTPEDVALVRACFQALGGGAS